MPFKIRGREFSVAGIQIRIPRRDGLTDDERIVVDKIANKMGYENVQLMAEENGYEAASEMAYHHSFKNPRDFFLGKGWPSRLSKYDKNNIDIVTDSEFSVIDPDYMSNIGKVRIASKTQENKE